MNYVDTSPARRRSRWDDSPKLDSNGNPIFIRAYPSDIELFKLLAPTANARTPWGYPVLPSNYFAPLLDRGEENILVRIADLSIKPHQYLIRPEQPRNNYRPLIYALGSRGADELRNEGLNVPWKHPRQLAHRRGRPWDLHVAGLRPGDVWHRARRGAFGMLCLQR